MSDVGSCAIPLGVWTVPRTWAWARLGDIATVVGGGTPSTAQSIYWCDGDVPWLTPADLSGYSAKMIASGARFITRAGLANSGAQVLPAGTVLMSSRAPVGYAAIAAQELSTNQGFKSFVLRDGILPDYVYWYLKANLSLLLAYASGTTFPELSAKRAAQVPIPLAPFAEQRRIVAVIEERLSALDGATALLSRARANLRRYEAAVLIAAVHGRLPRSIAPDAAPLAHAPGPWPLPPSWRWATVAGVGEVLLGRQRAPQYQTGRYSRPYLRVANIRDGQIDLSDVKEMDFDPNHFAKYALEPGDILVSEGQSPELVGQSAIYKGGIDGLCFQKTLHRFRSRAELVLPEFAQLVFRAFVKGGIFKRHASLTVNIAHLTLERFKAVPFPLPPIGVQREIVAEVERCLAIANRSLEEIDVQLARVARLRQSVLKRAFEGKLVSQDPDDEPASAMLERLLVEQETTGVKSNGSRSRRARRRDAD